EPVSDEEERRYLAYSVHSTALLDALRYRRDQFDAVLVGPYLFGLTADVARAFPEKTLLVSCFHDEPLARLQVWRRTYQGVGGILYHSSEEQKLAETVLGLNHPGGTQIDIAIDVGTGDRPAPDATEAGDGTRNVPATRFVDRPYLVYCGRYSIQKN